METFGYFFAIGMGIMVGWFGRIVYVNRKEKRAGKL